MRAIETRAKIDGNGNIILMHPLFVRDTTVRLILLLDNTKTKKERESFFLDSFGGWDMEESAEELVNSIRNSRYFRERNVDI
jgi:hypothetical protein